MFCTRCGVENPDAAQYCAKCGNRLSFLAPTPPSPGEPAAAGGPVVAKTPWVAALLSFFLCGLGQLYNADPTKAAVMLIAAILGVWLTAGLATFAVWIWAMIDAWQVAAGRFRRW